MTTELAQATTPSFGAGTSSSTGEPAMVDAREQLYNDRQTGTINQVQLPKERITRLHGVLFDLDPHLYLAGNGLVEPDGDPATFYQSIKPVLARHPLAGKAEV